jgi:hypothetical protein
MAYRSRSWTTDQPVKIQRQFYPLRLKQRIIRHDPIGFEISVPATFCVRSVVPRFRPRLWMRANSHGTSGARIHKGRRYFAMVDQTHGTPTKPAPGCSTDPVGKASISFDECVQPLVLLRQLQAEQSSYKNAHTRTQYLSRTEMAVQCCGLFKDVVQRQSAGYCLDHALLPTGTTISYQGLPASPASCTRRARQKFAHYCTTARNPMMPVIGCDVSMPDTSRSTLSDENLCNRVYYDSV